MSVYRSAAFVILMLATLPAAAQAPAPMARPDVPTPSLVTPKHQCPSLAVALANLKQNYNEVPVASGLNATGVINLITANPDSGSWTVLVITKTHRACAVAGGINWELMPSSDNPV